MKKAIVRKRSPSGGWVLIEIVAADFRLRENFLTNSQPKGCERVKKLPFIRHPGENRGPGSF